MTIAKEAALKRVRLEVRQRDAYVLHVYLFRGRTHLHSQCTIKRYIFCLNKITLSLLSPEKNNLKTDRGKRKSGMKETKIRILQIKDKKKQRGKKRDKRQTIIQFN